MIEISLLAGESLLALLWLACRAVVWLRQKHIDWKREAALALMYVNLAVILRFVFYPMDRLNGHVQPLVFDAAAMLPLRLNLIPIVHIMRFAGRRDMLLNLVGNVAMFIPGGVLMPLLYPKLNRFWKVTLAGALLSACIELAQLPFASRATDVDDLILNTACCAIGYGLYALGRLLAREYKKKEKGPQ